MLAKLTAFLRLGRPIFLVGGFLHYGLGAAIAAQRGAHIDWTVFAWGQAAITAAQLMTHYANDYFDLEADCANHTPTRWSGGSRVLPNGELPAWTALAASITLAAAAMAAIAVLHLHLHARRASVMPLVAAVVLAWAYSAPPASLHTRGLGELTTALVVAVLTPISGLALQARCVPLDALFALATPACLMFAMLLAIELPDAAGDAVVGKRTLVVRLGARWSARLYVAAIVLAYAGAAFAPLVVRLAIFATTPLAILQVRRVARGDLREPARWESVTFAAVAMVFLGAAAELIAFAALAHAAHARS